MKPITPSVSVPSASTNRMRTAPRIGVLPPRGRAAARAAPRPPPLRAGGVFGPRAARRAARARSGMGARPQRLAHAQRVVEERSRLLERELGGGIGAGARRIGMGLEE